MQRPPDLRRRAGWLVTALVACNLLAWGWAWSVFGGHPLLLGTALVAYGLGLRHAFDADHIAAIDNASRKLMDAGRWPVAVGLLFALGHSTVVVGVSGALALTGTLLQGRFESARIAGATLGTALSGTVLLVLAVCNIPILVRVLRAWRGARRGRSSGEESLTRLLANGALAGPVLRRLFHLVGRTWHLYPLGLLFGLGFDTATEVALLGISATSTGQGISFGSILVFPTLFTAGMALVDTLDGILMLGAYGWAFAEPARKLHYNLAITVVSIATAVSVGGLELLGLLSSRLRLHGSFWGLIERLNADINLIGLLIVATLLTGWLLAIMLHRHRRPFELEVSTDQ